LLAQARAQLAVQTGKVADAGNTARLVAEQVQAAASAEQVSSDSIGLYIMICRSSCG
jgi:hypothetical protein